MIKQTITYKDFNGDEHTEDFWFNLSQDELADLAIIEETDLNASFKAIVARNNPKEILSTFREVLLASYGQRSGDGRRFMKSPEISAEFKSTGAWGVLYMRLVTDAAFAAEFVNGLVPAEVASQQASTFIRPQTRDHQPKAPVTVHQAPPVEDRQYQPEPPRPIQDVELPQTQAPYEPPFRQPAPRPVDPATGLPWPDSQV